MKTHIQYSAAMTLSAIYHHAHPQEGRKWHIQEVGYNFKLSAKGETPDGSVASTNINSIKSYRKKSYYKRVLLHKC